MYRSIWICACTYTPKCYREIIPCSERDFTEAGRIYDGIGLGMVRTVSIRTYMDKARMMGDALGFGGKEGWTKVGWHICT